MQKFSLALALAAAPLHVMAEDSFTDFAEPACVDTPELLPPTLPDCDTASFICGVAEIAQACQATCGVCPTFPPTPTVGDFVGCGAEVMIDVDEARYDSFIATLTDIAGFQFSIEIDGVLVEDLLVGDGIGGIAAQLGWEVSAGAGNVVGVDLSGGNIIPAGFFGHLARLIREDGTDPLLTGSTVCLTNIVIADEFAVAVPSFSSCSTVETTECLSVDAPFPAPPIPSPPPSISSPPPSASSPPPSISSPPPSPLPPPPSPSPPPSPPSPPSPPPPQILDFDDKCVDDPSLIPEETPFETCEQAAVTCALPVIALACPVTCGFCPIFPDFPDFDSFNECGVFLEAQSFPEYFDVFIATTVDVAGFQFSITVNGILFEDELTGSDFSGIAAQLGFEITGGNGVVVGVDVSGSNIIPALFCGHLTRLIRPEGLDVPLPTGDTCIIDSTVGDMEGIEIPSFSNCTPESQCLVGFPQPPPPSPSPSPPFPPMKMFPPIPECADNDDADLPIDGGCGANVALCGFALDVTMNCPVTCNLCPATAPDLPSDFGNCGAFMEALNLQINIQVFIATCVDIWGFQFSIEIEGDVIVDSVIGLEGVGLAAINGMQVSGGAGNIVGIDLSGQGFIPAGSFGLLTWLVIEVLVPGADPPPFPAGVPCVNQIILSDEFAMQVDGFSVCTAEVAACLVPPPFPPPSPPFPPLSLPPPSPSPPPASPPPASPPPASPPPASPPPASPPPASPPPASPPPTSPPPASPPPPTVVQPLLSVISDPHFVGFLNQTYDVTGITGHIYSIIADEEMYINSRFETAYTSGVYLDPNSNAVKNYRPRGTWMADIGVVLGDASSEVTIVASKDTPTEVGVCAEKPQDCFFGGVGGSITVNGETLLQVGSLKVSDDVTVKLANLKKFSRVSISSSPLKVDLDYVPAPEEWKIDDEERAAYGHFNLKINNIVISPKVNGVLGASARMKYTKAGNPIMKALNKDGEGILDKPVEAYEVSSLSSKYSLYSTTPLISSM